MSAPFYLFAVQRLDGTISTLEAYIGKVILVVNTASRCHFTAQYAELENIYRRYSDRDFVVLGFPCNQFAAQEPNNEAWIANFCRTSYDISFPIFSKTVVNGPQTHPLYQYLKNSMPGAFGSTAIKWNFTKFLIDRKGQVVKRFSPLTKAKKLREHIESLL